MIIITLLNIAIFQGIILSIIILKSPIFKSSSNKYLACAIFTLSISLLNFVLDETDIYNNIPLLQFIDIIDSGVLFPIFIFLYVVHQVNHPIKNSKKIVWLFIPYLYTLISSILDIDIVNNSLQISNIYIIIIDIFEILNIFLFIPGILIFTYTFIKFSNNTQEKKWLTNLWLLTFMLFIFWILTLFSSILLNYDFTKIMKILTVIFTLLIHWISYFGIFKFRLAKEQEEIKALISKGKKDNNKKIVIDIKIPKTKNVEKTELFTKENSYFKKLETLCIDNEIYKDSTLDRDKVARMLGISSGYVSQLINNITENNFATYINQYRVEAVKKIILNSEFDNYSLLAIGLECGFSSKSTFHNTFKKITGITPNTYKKLHK